MQVLKSERIAWGGGWAEYQLDKKNSVCRKLEQMLLEAKFLKQQVQNVVFWRIYYFIGSQAFGPLLLLNEPIVGHRTHHPLKPLWNIHPNNLLVTTCWYFTNEPPGELVKLDSAFKDHSPYGFSLLHQRYPSIYFLNSDLCFLLSVQLHFFQMFFSGYIFSFQVSYT